MNSNSKITTLMSEESVAGINQDQGILETGETENTVGGPQPVVDSQQALERQDDEKFKPQALLENSGALMTEDNEKILKMSEDSLNSLSLEKKDSNCYCGKGRNLNIVELLCANCTGWFHESCISYQLGKIVPFLSNYIFLCKNCSATGLESFKKTQAQISQMCIAAIANLQQACFKECNPRLMFSKDKEIIPYIEQNWEAITTIPRRVTQSWHATVHKTLVKDIHLWFVFEEGQDNDHMYGLLNSELTSIRPNYKGMIKIGSLKVTDTGIHRISATGGVKSRQAKKKAGDVSTAGKSRDRGVDQGTPKLPSHGYPLDHPFNKNGYRYFLAEPDPNAPCRQEFYENGNWVGKPIPGWMYRTLIPTTVLLALHDRAPQLKISEDRLSVTGDKGYSTVRANHSVTKGIWYWEAIIEDMPEGSACRLGWGQDYAKLQAPLGYDEFGYSWRSRKGTKFHESNGKSFNSGFIEGDVVGFMIILPYTKHTKLVPNSYKDKPLINFKSNFYYEKKDSVEECTNSLEVLPGSKILFFKNGECQGVAFEDIYCGSYYPTLSLFRNITVKTNFGPNFKCPPPQEKFNYRPMSEKSDEAVCEQTVADMLYLTENEGKLRLDTQ